MLKSVELPYYTYDVCIDGDYAYVAMSNARISVIDITDPANPGEPQNYTFSGVFMGIIISGDYAYTANYGNGLTVFNISDPDYLEEITYPDTDGLARDVKISGDYAYIVSYISPYNFDVIQIRERVDTRPPVITKAPSNIIVPPGYVDQTLNWTATDSNPFNYTIIQTWDGTMVVNSTEWHDGEEVYYEIPEDLEYGIYEYEINFTDQNLNYQTDRVNFTVWDYTDPVITDYPTDLVINIGFGDLNLSWTAIDDNPKTYMIELVQTGYLLKFDTWENGSAIDFEIPKSFSVGTYTLNITFTDEYGNSASHVVTLTINALPPTISLGYFYMIFIVIGTLSVGIVVKRKSIFNN